MEYKELILDMLNRIVKLEKEVELLKKEIKLCRTSSVDFEKSTIYHYLENRTE